jgi:tRNA-dihydrouridine synthase
MRDDDHPLAGQIIGSDPGNMARAARYLHDSGHDVIDLNLACPVRRITNQPRGGHLLMDPRRAVAVLRAVRDALPPAAVVTASLRRSFDDTAEARQAFEEIVQSLWSLDYAAIRVHARTVVQKYMGKSRWDVLRQVKSQWPDRTILGSGDVFTAEDAVGLLKETGVDVVWIARGAIGNPWIFDQARQLLSGHSPVAPTVHEQRRALVEHLAISREIHDEPTAARRARKMGIKSSRFHPAAADVKKAFINAGNLHEWTAVLDRHYGDDAAGVWPAADAADEVDGQIGD